MCVCVCPVREVGRSLSSPPDFNDFKALSPPELRPNQIFSRRQKKEKEKNLTMCVFDSPVLWKRKTPPHTHILTHTHTPVIGPQRRSRNSIDIPGNSLFLLNAIFSPVLMNVDPGDLPLRDTCRAHTAWGPSLYVFFKTQLKLSHQYDLETSQLWDQIWCFAECRFLVQRGKCGVFSGGKWS